MATLTVEVGPSILTHPQSQTAFVGAAVTFSVVATGTDPLTMQWRKDGVDILGATISSLTIDPVSLADAGMYDVVVSNVCGTVVSDAAILTVRLFGDLNCDGRFDGADIDVFFEVLGGP